VLQPYTYIGANAEPYDIIYGTIAEEAIQSRIESALKARSCHGAEDAGGKKKKRIIKHYQAEKGELRPTKLMKSEPRDAKDCGS
jgi:hypothetical protein